MRIRTIKIENYGPFKSLEEIKFGALSTIIGKNDVGKSFILRALKLFFDKKPKIEENDVHTNSSPDDNVVIEVTFDSLPQNIELEDGILTTFKEEMLLDENGHLRIKKIFPRGNLSKFQVYLIANDFTDDNYAELVNLKEPDLNVRCDICQIPVIRSGRGVTNKSKRELLREKAVAETIEIRTRNIDISKNDRLIKTIEDNFPDFEIFQTDTSLDIGENLFQKEFRPIIYTAAEQKDVQESKNVFAENINKALQKEIDTIFEYFKQYTDVFVSLKTKPDFSWDKAVTFDIIGKDNHGIEISLDKRGSGLKRLLMVSFFQYMADRDSTRDCNCIFAVEEPENCLHPGLQRELINSFNQITTKGGQIIITSHSPVFAGASPTEDLVLIVREKGEAKVIQSPELDLARVSDELGVEPSDQITCYNACVFVEGITDINLLKTMAEKLKNSGHIKQNFDDKKIGFISFGGDNLKHWINMKALKKLTRRFAVVIDSDKENEAGVVNQRKLNWKNKCEIDGGIFFITKKRELENYLHIEAIRRRGGFKDTPFNDYTDMKKEFGKNVYKAMDSATADELLERDRYYDNGIEHHEIKEMIEQFLNLC